MAKISRAILLASTMRRHTLEPFKVRIVRPDPTPDGILSSRQSRISAVHSDPANSAETLQ